MDETPNNEKRPVELNREQLHALVWSTSMSQLAQRFGVSGNGLKKICDRLEVPYPSLGHWAKKGAGHDVPSKPLPNAGPNTPGKVAITPTPPPPAPPATAAEVQAKINAMVRDWNVDPGTGAKPHPLIAAWIAEIERKQKRSKPGDWDYPGDITDMHRRQLRILSAIFTVLAKHKVKVTHERDNQFSLQLGEESIEMSVRERQRQTIGASAGDKHHAYPGQWPARDNMRGAGKLTVSIKGYLPGNLRSEWIESDDAPLEALAPEIAGTLLAAFPLLAKRTEERREAEHQRRLEEQRRYEEQQTQKLEDNRWRRFVEIARQLQDALLARQLLQALRSREGIDGDVQIGDRSLTDWIAWTESELTARDPAQSPERVYRSLNSVTAWTSRD